VPLAARRPRRCLPSAEFSRLWLTATGALLVNISLFIGEFSRAGWLPYPPFSELAYSPGVGVDYYLWALQISGIANAAFGNQPCDHPSSRSAVRA